MIDLALLRLFVGSADFPVAELLVDFLLAAVAAVSKLAKLAAANDHLPRIPSSRMFDIEPVVGMLLEGLP